MQTHQHVGLPVSVVVAAAATSVSLGLSRLYLARQLRVLLAPFPVYRMCDIYCCKSSSVVTYDTDADYMGPGGNPALELFGMLCSAWLGPTLCRAALTNSRQRVHVGLLAWGGAALCAFFAQPGHAVCDSYCLATWGTC